MSYRKATHILPQDLIEIIQEYVDGECLYIPCKNRKVWGSRTELKQELAKRDAHIYEEYLLGASTSTLAQKYYLSIKSIQRIILMKKKA